MASDSYVGLGPCPIAIEKNSFFNLRRKCENNFIQAKLISISRVFAFKCKLGSKYVCLRAGGYSTFSSKCMSMY